MIICEQLARAKAATDLRIFMCSGSLGFFYIAPVKGVFLFKECHWNSSERLTSIEFSTS